MRSITTIDRTRGCPGGSPGACCSSTRAHPVTGEASNGASAWARFWYGPEPALNLAAARVLLAAAGLWVVLSRHDLPGILAYPPELWAGVSPERRLRFLMVLDVGAERALYALLHAALVCALLGVWPRVACFASGLLLYHFAPFETIIRRRSCGCSFMFASM